MTRKRKVKVDHKHWYICNCLFSCRNKQQIVREKEEEEEEEAEPTNRY